MISGKGIGYSASTITNDGFWPDIFVGDFERSGALPADMDSTATGAALLAAIGEINLQLDEYRERQEARGYASSRDVPGPRMVHGDNALTANYIAAVYARAKAALLPEFATVTERDARKDLAERSVPLRDQLLATSQQLVRTIKGKRRVGVALL
ncbi:head protein [Aeromonas veronii]|uniref:Head protein n=1 Tax=Aeromonas veronii TaxID=654 RepID=A0A3A9I2N7_AERVE|nr:head completion/stabilization protein [Aeromonas veronii]RKJ83819.1 head protein [Aeromonas veronii]RKJ84539.1 head protein [Aeromonas veronii]RKJ90166.1 head protein [Aeromonas veronii]RKJ92292.1 head protein [Aeromonas veronii]